MTFNSSVFLQFFAAFLLLYWLARGHLRARNWLIVAASYLFYGWWDWRFLSLLFFTSLVDFVVGLRIERAPTNPARRAWLTASIVVNLVVLGTFKYYGFFIDSFADLLRAAGLTPHLPTLHIVLPVGISFYTFQSMSYAIDVYRRELNPTRSLINFLAFVSFFPQLVAGPIERAAHLLPQFERTVRITPHMLEEGLWLVLWGLFKKVVLADNLAPLTDLVFQADSWNAPGVLLGTIAFGFQIYCDFSGYSDIARGTARMLGFDILFNFNLPYAAANPREFWRRWHISLSTWLRDYLYIPLGGNRRGPARTYVNLMVTMLLGGLWHGAAWNFVLWGAWHGAGLAAHRAVTKGRGEESARPEGRFQPLSWLATMLFVFYGWLLFRAHSFGQVVAMTRALEDFTVPAWFVSYVVNLVAFTAPLLVMELWQLRHGGPLAPLRWPRWIRGMVEGALLLGIILYWSKDNVPFIYFQF